MCCCHEVLNHRSGEDLVLYPRPMLCYSLIHLLVSFTYINLITGTGDCIYNIPSFTICKLEVLPLDLLMYKFQDLQM